MRVIYIVLIILASLDSVQGQDIARVKYDGGGDWYANPTALPNLATFCNENIDTNITSKIATVEVGSVALFQYPIVFLTGHGNVFFSESDVENLRTYLESGGFLHISDNYGFDPYIRKEIKKIFPNQEFQEIPYNHPIYHQSYDFDTGVPKIHEHDGKGPQGYGLFVNGRLVCFYDFESDLNDGWEDPEVHNDPENIRLKALRMGANIVQYAFSN